MFRRERHRLAKAQIKAFERTRRARPPLGFIGDEDQRLVGAPDEIGEEPVGRS